MTQLEMKKIVLQALESNDLDIVVSLARENRKAMSLLIRMAYDKETLVGWRAIKAVGRTAKELAKSDHEFLRITVRKLLWSLSDESGGIGWSAAELLGEIVSSDPERFADIIPLIAEVYDIEERTFRPGVVYALKRIAKVSPESVVKYQDVILRALVDSDAMTRVYALELVEILWATAFNKKYWPQEFQEKVKYTLKGLKDDAGVAWIYKKVAFIDVQVGEMAIKVANGM